MLKNKLKQINRKSKFPTLIEWFVIFAIAFAIFNFVRFL